MAEKNPNPAKQAFTLDDIDDAMVERVYQRAKRLGVMVRADLKAEIRMMLETAFTTEPPKPEVIVTSRMHAAGVDAWRRWIDDSPWELWPSCIKRVYVAMERERMAEAAEKTLAEPGRFYRGHRRKDDP